MQDNHTTISGHVAGDVSGQVAIGTGIEQRTHMSADTVDGNSAPRVRVLLDQLRTAVQVETPRRYRRSALARLDELEAALLAPAADVATIERITQWFADRIPSIAGAVSKVLLTPVVGQLVEASGAMMAEEFGRRIS